MTEQEMAEPVVEWLHNLGCEVYQEVQVWTYGCRADIVARLGPILWVVECKRSFGMKVLSQAYEWQVYANRVSVAVPMRHFTRFESAILEHFGVGVLQATRSSLEDVRERYPAKINRRPPMRDYLLRSLVDERKNFAKAGNARSDYWTPYQETCRSVHRYVTAHPGCTFKELLNAVDTHYASKATARSALAKWIREGAVKGVRLKREGRRLSLYPEEVVA